MALFPPTDTELNDWLAQFQAYLGVNYVALGLVAQDLNDQGAAATAWHTALSDHRAAQAAALEKTQAKDAARQALEAALRALILKITAHPGLTDAERAALGLNIPDATHTPAGVPATRPAVQVRVAGRLQHRLDFKDETVVSGHAKPAGVRGAQIWCKVGEAPAGPTDCHFLAEDTATPYVATFEAADAGKLAFYQLRWVNTRGETGPWSEVVSAMITP